MTTAICVPAVTLRPLTVDDVTPAYVQWLNDPEVTRYLMAGRTPQTAETIRAFIRTVATPFAIDHDGGFVGTICLRTIDWVSGLAEVGILLGDRRVWGRGVASAALVLLERHAFDEYELRKLWAGTCNPACARLFDRAGWRYEGTQVRQHYLRGTWVSHTLWGIHADD